MKQLRKSLTIAGSVGQMLGLVVLIFLLTQTGRKSMSEYGWLNVLIVAFSLFLIVELLVLLVAHRVQKRLENTESPRTRPRFTLL